MKWKFQEKYKQSAKRLSWLHMYNIGNNRKKGNLFDNEKKIVGITRYL
jgi:hypothetical protein